MTHLFEFIITKKQTEEEITQKKEKDIINLMYKTESNRKNKVYGLILKELKTKGVIKPEEVEEFLLRQLK